MITFVSNSLYKVNFCNNVDLYPYVLDLNKSHKKIQNCYYVTENKKKQKLKNKDILLYLHESSVIVNLNNMEYVLYGHVFLHEDDFIFFEDPNFSNSIYSNKNLFQKIL